MSEFIKNSIKTLFLFIVFLIFIVVLIICVLGFNNIGYSSGYLLSFFNIFYIAGIFPLFFAFWLVFSSKSMGEWRFGLLAFLLFLMLFYYHYLLSLYYALTSVDNFKYLLILDEIILLYVLMSFTSCLSVGLKNDGELDETLGLEVFKLRFRLIFTFFLLSLFALYFYDALGSYSQINLTQANFSITTFPYVFLIKALLNSGLLPLIFILWLIYSPLVRGNIYYYISLTLILVFIYCFQIFFVKFYFYKYVNDWVGYWILECMVLVMVYFAATISYIFSDQFQGR